MTGAKIKLAGIFLIVFVLAGMFTFRKTDQVKQEEVFQGSFEKIDIAQNDLNETDEDLLNVDYSDFYDKLSPHGEWIEVTGNDIGVDLKKSTSGIDADRTVSFADVFGVKDAYALDMAFGAIFVWRPSPDIALSVVAGEPAPMYYAPPQPVYYTPYTNGRWIYTNAGWYFQAPTPYEEIVHHYGRWVFSPTLGWVWMPGRVWSPAWVEWRVSPGYVAWAPVPPSVYLVNNYYYPPVIYEERFVIVENRYFLEPVVYNYVYTYPEYGRFITIYEMQRVDGIVIRDNYVYNVGPDITVIERDWGSPVEVVTVNRVEDYGYVGSSGGQVYSYSPGFKKLKDKANYTVIRPDKYETYSNVKNRPNDAGQFGYNDKERTFDLRQDKSKSDGTKQWKNDRRDNPDKVFKNDGNYKSGKDRTNDNTKWSGKQEKSKSGDNTNWSGKKERSKSSDYKVKSGKQDKSKSSDYNVKTRKQDRQKSGNYDVKRKDNAGPRKKQDRGSDNTQWKGSNDGSNDKGKVKEKGNYRSGDKNNGNDNGQRNSPGPRQKDMNSGKDYNKDQKSGNNKPKDGYTKQQDKGSKDQGTGKNNNSRKSKK